MHASTLQRIEKDYLDIAKKVGIAGWDSSDPNVDKLQLVKHWFEETISGHWILILDHADDVDLLFGSSRLADYFPRSLHGAILLTTRNKQVASKFAPNRQHVLHVRAFEDSESVNLLKAKIGDQFGDDDYIRLANALDHVPLALVQAAAFICEQEISIAKYLSHYDQSDTAKIQLLSEDFEDDMRDQDIKNPVAATFAISFEQIRKSNSRAADVLSMMSMLDAQAIPMSLLPLDQAITSTKALGMLQAFSLITKASEHKQEDQFFNIHRLVRLAMRNWLSIHGELQLWVRKALMIISEQFPAGGIRNVNLCRTYLPHALVILSSAPMLQDPSSGEMMQPRQEALSEAQLSLAALQLHVSYHYSSIGDYHSAVPVAQASLASREAVLGTKHPDTLRSMLHLASLLERAGKYDEAEPISRQVLRLCENMRGIEHPNTLDSMRSLAWLLHVQSKYVEAETLGRRALALSMAMFGIEHEDTLKSMNTLACILDRRGKYDEAEQMAGQALVLGTKVLGTENPKTLSAMNNLIVVLEHRGKYDEAVEMSRQTLTLSEKALGTEHPNTLATMSNLATALNHQDKHDEAEQMSRQTFMLHKKVLGTEHPNTVFTMNNLATVLNRQGQYDEAEEMSRQALTLHKKMLGTEHPATLSSMHDRTVILNSQGKYEEAEDMGRQTLVWRKKILGVKHPHTFEIVDVLMAVLNNQDKHDEAEHIWKTWRD